MSLMIEQLCKYYDAQMGVEEVNLKVKSGAFYGFIGPNGAGKSTTLKVLMNLIFPTSGNCTILDLDVVDFALHLKPFIGYLSSEINLYDEIKVKDIFKMNRAYYTELKIKNNPLMLASWYELSKEEKNKRLIEEQNRLVALLGIDLEKKFSTLSFGNKKKVGYALSVMHDPSVIMLDEPTNGLDPVIKDKIFEDLHMRNDKGATVFLSSHNLDEVEKHCTNVAFIKMGKIIKDTTIENIKAHELKNVTLKLTESNFEMARVQLEMNYTLESVEKIKGMALAKLKLTGNLSQALEYFSKLDLVDITIESPSLEELFKFYY